MESKSEQTPETNANLVLSVNKDGTALYSNKAGIALLNEWEVEIGEKLPSHIGDIAQRIISLNSPEKMEVKVGNIIYLVVFSPLPEQECVNISGFDICDQKKVEEKLQESKEQYRMLFNHNMDGIILTDSRDGRKILSVNPIQLLAIC